MLLLERGADPNVANKDGDTALMFAAWRAGRGLVQALIEKGADPSAKNGEGKPVLKWASGRDEIAKVIQDAAAAKKRNPNGNVNGNANNQVDGR